MSGDRKLGGGANETTTPIHRVPRRTNKTRAMSAEGGADELTPPDGRAPLPAKTRRRKAACVEGGAYSAATPMKGLPLPDTILRLRELQRMRVQTMRSQRRLMNAAGAYVRLLLGWRPDAPDAVKITKAAASIVDEIAETGDTVSVQAAAAVPFVQAALAGKEPLDKLRVTVEAEMLALAKSLPIVPWVASVRGLGLMSMAKIIGEIGDPSAYGGGNKGGPAKIWKRLGLAPVNGKSASRWRVEGGLSAEDWVGLGYSPLRRSEMWNIGANLLKAGGPYKALYDERKAYEKARDPEIRPIAAHLRAQRYMEKRLIREMWRAWRDAVAVPAGGLRDAA